ncbi:hypothetical protein PV410_35230 [Streptomyces sp. PA03-5A]|nr:hypothetical protein [Streptomyces sp. PA03-5A]
MDAHELKLWRHQHPNYTYWCGYELGGCGWKLVDKLYRDRVCHFAHAEGGPVCARTATGETSADHLFVKRGLRRLLDRHDLRGTVETRSQRSGAPGMVDVYLPTVRRRIRFQLSPLDYRSWRAANAALTEDVDDVDWLFGTEGPLTRELLARNGFGLRFRLETVGGERHVHIGAQTRQGSIHWTPLDECELRPDGLWTPATEEFREIRASARRGQPGGFTLQGGVTFIPDLDAPVPDGSPFSGGDRRFLMADVKPSAGPIVRAVLSLPADAEVSRDHAYRASDSARLLVHENGGWALRLNGYIRLNATEAARSGLLGVLPEPTEVAASNSVVRDRAVAAIKPADKQQRAAADQPRQLKSPLKLTQSEAVVRAREILLSAAAAGRTLSWSNVASQLGARYSSMREQDRTAFLVEVDTPLWESKPVLSAILRDSDALLSCLPAVLDGLGVAGAAAVPAEAPVLRQWAEREQERAFALYGKPPRVMPPRLDLRPARTAARLTVREKKVVDALTKRIRQGTVKDPSANRRRPVGSPEERRRVREAITRVERKMVPLSKALPEVKSAREILTRARLWLKYSTPGAELPSIPTVLEQRALGASSASMLAALKSAQSRLEGAKTRDR